MTRKDNREIISVALDRETMEKLDYLTSKTGEMNRSELVRGCISFAAEKPRGFINFMGEELMRERQGAAPIWVLVGLAVLAVVVLAAMFVLTKG